MADYSITAATAATVKPKPEMAAADKLKQMQGKSVSVCDVPEAGTELMFMKQLQAELVGKDIAHSSLDKDIAKLEKGLAACK